jgi:hypothetical protein
LCNYSCDGKNDLWGNLSPGVEKSDLWGGLVQLRVRIGLVSNERQLLVVLVESFSGVISTKIYIITSLVREEFCQCSYESKDPFSLVEQNSEILPTEMKILRYLVEINSEFCPTRINDFNILVEQNTGNIPVKLNKPTL